MDSHVTRQTSKDSSFVSLSVQGTVLLFSILTLFLVLTGAVPLVQLGIIPDLGRKSRYVNPALICVTVYYLGMILLNRLTPYTFQKLYIVNLWNKACRVPLVFCVTLIALTYFALTLSVGFERYLAFETRGFDLGIFAQAVWNTTQGKFLFSSIKENICLLGDHVSPILVLTAPFYKLWPDPRMLIALQAFAAASNFIPLALLAENKLQNRSLTLVLLCMYFFFYPMRSALHEDFHPEVIAESFLWWAFLFLENKKIKLFLVCLLIAAGGKENFLGITFMLGFYALIWKKMRALGGSIMFVSVALLFWETRWLVPHLSGQPFFYAGNYSEMTGNPLLGLFQRLFNPESLGYFLKVFAPFLFLPFFHIPTLFLTFPILFQNLLSSSGGMRSFNYHYLTGLTPFLFIATIYAIRSLRDKSIRFNRYLGWVGMLLLFTAVARSGPSEYYFYWQSHDHQSEHLGLVREKLQSIPSNAKVLTHNNFIPQLCNREFIYQFDYNTQHSKLDFAKRYEADYVIGDMAFWEPGTPTPAETIKEFLAAGYQLSFEKDGFFILKR